MIQACNTLRHCEKAFAQIQKNTRHSHTVASAMAYQLAVHTGCSGCSVNAKRVFFAPPVAATHPAIPHIAGHSSYIQACGYQHEEESIPCTARIMNTGKA
jgi:hypothetical protein